MSDEVIADTIVSSNQPVPTPEPTVISQIPFIIPGVIELGPDNPSAIVRLANYAQKIINSGEPIPKSPFIEWAADRLTGTDRQDVIVFLQGRRGSGKSYSLLYIAKRLAEAVAERKGGTWKDYFSLKHCATLEDTESVMSILKNAGQNQIVIIDDCSLAISNRSWNSPQNKNFNALLTVCRTNRWALLLSAPLKGHVDNQVRDMCDLTGTVYKSFHAGGFNIIKINSSEIASSGKEYKHKMNFGNRKIDMWVAFAPDKEIVKQYNTQREKSALDINERIVETGSFRSTAPKKRPLSEVNFNNLIDSIGLSVKKYATDNPDASLNNISARFGKSGYTMKKILAYYNLPTRDRK